MDSISSDKKFTQNFSLNEFIHSDISIERGLDNRPSAPVITNLMQLATFCEKVREVLDNKPMLISSGYRCKELNAIVGGAEDSAHLFGLACDFSAPAFGKVEAVFKKIVLSKLLFDQLIYEFHNTTVWVHISIPAFNSKPRRQVLHIAKES